MLIDGHGWVVVLLIVAVGLATSLWRGRWWQAFWEGRMLAREVAVLSPLDFEHYVAAVFQARAWRAQVVPAGGDQGAGVVAISPQGDWVVVQVEHRRSHVGNTAVQQVAAARPLYRATHALVVTSGPGYSRAAAQLAQARGVALWRPADLRRLQNGGTPAGLPNACEMGQSSRPPRPRRTTS